MKTMHEIAAEALDILLPDWRTWSGAELVIKWWSLPTEFSKIYLGNWKALKDGRRVGELGEDASTQAHELIQAWSSDLLGPAGGRLLELHMAVDVDRFRASTEVPDAKAGNDFSDLIGKGFSANPDSYRMSLRYKKEMGAPSTVTLEKTTEKFAMPELAQWSRKHRAWRAGIGYLFVEVGHLKDEIIPVVMWRPEKKSRTMEERRLEGGVERLYGFDLIPLVVDSDWLVDKSRAFCMRRAEAEALWDEDNRAAKNMLSARDLVTISHWEHQKDLDGRHLYEKKEELTINPILIEGIELASGSEGTIWFGRTIEQVFKNRELERLGGSEWHSPWRAGAGHALYGQERDKMMARVWSFAGGCDAYVFPLDRPSLRFRYNIDNRPMAKAMCDTALVRIGFGEWLDNSDLGEHLEIARE